MYRSFTMTHTHWQTPEPLRAERTSRNVPRQPEAPGRDRGHHRAPNPGVIVRVASAPPSIVGTAHAGARSYDHGVTLGWAYNAEPKAPAPQAGPDQQRVHRLQRG